MVDASNASVLFIANTNGQPHYLNSAGKVVDISSGSLFSDDTNGFSYKENGLVHPVVTQDPDNNLSWIDSKGNRINPPSAVFEAVNAEAQGFRDFAKEKPVPLAAAQAQTAEQKDFSLSNVIIPQSQAETLHNTPPSPAAPVAAHPAEVPAPRKNDLVYLVSIPNSDGYVILDKNGKDITDRETPESRQNQQVFSLKDGSQPDFIVKENGKWNHLGDDVADTDIPKPVLDAAAKIDAQKPPRNPEQPILGAQVSAAPPSAETPPPPRVQPTTDAAPAPNLDTIKHAPTHTREENTYVQGMLRELTSRDLKPDGHLVGAPGHHSTQAAYAAWAQEHNEKYPDNTVPLTLHNPDGEININKATFAALTKDYQDKYNDGKPPEKRITADGDFGDKTRRAIRDNDPEVKASLQAQEAMGHAHHQVQGGQHSTGAVPLAHSPVNRGQGDDGRFVPH